MAFDWKEFHSLAQFLESLQGSNFSAEAALRSSVSRSYYAAFCQARNSARDEQGFIPLKKPRTMYSLSDIISNSGCLHLPGP